MTQLTRDELITGSLKMVAWAARRYKLRKGITVEDLESVGHEALVKAADHWDPAGGAAFKTFAIRGIRSAILGFLRKEDAKPTRGLEIMTDDGEYIPRADVKAKSPSALAGILDAPQRADSPFVTTRGRLTKGMPPVDAVVAAAQVLREAMFSAIQVDDVQEMMSTLMKQAKAGDLRAIRTVIDVLAPHRTGKTIIQQQAVIVQREDLS